MGMTAQHLRMQPDGSLRSYSADAEALVLKLDRPKPNIRVTSRKVVDYAADASAGSIAKRVSMSRRNTP
jgi:hypothetical protein